MTTDDEVGENVEPKDSSAFQALLGYLWKSRGFDFSGYKRTSLSRRIRRRMQTIGSETYADYLDYLQVYPDEFLQLFNTILINVTSFFRDPEAWAAVGDHLRRVLAERDPGSPIRVWSAGCASGEEAYSLAMMLDDMLGSQAYGQRVKIYATDIDEEALTQARLAAYPPKAIEGMPTAFVERYLTRTNSSYVVNKELRRSVIFGRHDLVQDAPISRVDVLSCRNTLMYFNAEAQSRILGRLHFALTGDGLLFLGKAEMLLTHSSMFTPVDLKLRLFTRVAPRGKAAMSASGLSSPAIQRSVAQNRLQRAAFDVMPLASIVLDETGHITMANQRATAMFGISPVDVGRAFHELELSYRPIELRSVIDQAQREQRAVTLNPVERLSPSGDKSFIMVEVSPLRSDAGDRIGMQLLFGDRTQVLTLQQELGKVSHDLAAAHEELQSTSEELETTNEELQSTVEELETTNEELQSTNEELETMNEELQSTNEELQTMHQELRDRGVELNDANAFLGAILSGLQSGVVVVDDGLMVRVWNDEMVELWGPREDEVQGKNLMGLDIGLPVAQLRAPIRAAFADSASEHELECTNRRGRAVRCHVTVTPLRGLSPANVLLLVEELP